MDTWRSWELVLPALERHHEVLAPTFVGHAGGPPLRGPVTETLLADTVEQTMEAAGFETAHIAGSSLGGYVALQLAERGRARSVVAIAPAGGWPRDQAMDELFRRQRDLQAQARRAAAHVDSIVATPEGRQAAMQLLVERADDVPAEIVARQLMALARCDAAPAFLEFVEHAQWHLDAERIACPLRFLWGTHDRLLPWPQAAQRYRSAFPHAEWITLDGVGHYPQLEAATETAQLIHG